MNIHDIHHDNTITRTGIITPDIYIYVSVARNGKHPRDCTQYNSVFGAKAGREVHIRTRHIKLTSVLYNTHACVSGFLTCTFSWRIIHPSFLSNHSHCACIPSVISCNTKHSLTSQQPSSYPLPILSVSETASGHTRIHRQKPYNNTSSAPCPCARLFVTLHCGSPAATITTTN